jgi:hypothetical protein
MAKRNHKLEEKVDAYLESELGAEERPKESPEPKSDLLTQLKAVVYVQEGESPVNKLSDALAISVRADQPASYREDMGKRYVMIDGVEIPTDDPARTICEELVRLAQKS